MTCDRLCNLPMAINSGWCDFCKSLSRHNLSLLWLLVLCGCSSQGIIEAPSNNHNGRVRYLVIHHTSENFAASFALLTQPSESPVSAHYLIPEPGDTSYTKRALKVYRLVPESRRAWHAGQSYWNGEAALNDHSIGVELVNKTYCAEPTAENPEDPEIAESLEIPETPETPVPGRFCFYPDFAEQQLALLFELVADILHPHPDIEPTAIVGHADIAPDRKIDPGPRFPWQRLYRYGFGAWFDDDTVMNYWDRFRKSLPPIDVLQLALQAYGYQIEATGIKDHQTQMVVRAFQMHFRPMLVTGEIDAGSAAILFALLEKYRPERLQELAGQFPATGIRPFQAPLLID